MSATSFLSLVNGQMSADIYPARDRSTAVRRAVTISRQAGCGAREVAEKLAARMQVHQPHDASPWTVFDRDLMDKVLEQHQLPKYLARFLPEDRIPVLESMMNDIFNLYPAQQTIVKQTAETLLGLAELGSAILIGRAGNIVTAQMKHVLHVRLVAPLDQRIRHAREDYGMEPIQARNFCLREDLGRERYVRKYFNADINDPLLYHMVINTGLVGYDVAARLIEDALLQHD